MDTLISLGPHQVPGLWKHLLPQEFFSFEVPRECQATCHDCPEVRDSGFRPDYRCCTFQPRISNFMLGLAHANGGQESHQVITELLAKDYLVPEGLIASPKRWGQFLQDQANDKFGKSTDVLCDFLNLDSGLCSIYNYRNGPCSTFFCRHDDGEFAEQFWDSLMIYINQIEHSLSQWVMAELGINPSRYFAEFDKLSRTFEIFHSHQGLGWPKSVLVKLWGSWAGRELEFFEAAGKLIETNQDHLIQIAGSVSILESRLFEDRALKAMPQNWRDEVDECDIEDGQPSSLNDLFKTLIFYYREWRRKR